jgi:hypothetical protein
VDRIYLSQERTQWRVPAKTVMSSIKGGEFLGYLGECFSRRTLLHGVSYLVS